MGKKIQAGENDWVYEEAGYGLEGFVTRKPGEDSKDPGQPLSETKASRTKRQKRGTSTKSGSMKWICWLRQGRNGKKDRDSLEELGPIK